MWQLFAGERPSTADFTKSVQPSAQDEAVSAEPWYTLHPERSRLHLAAQSKGVIQSGNHLQMNVLRLWRIERASAQDEV